MSIRISSILLMGVCAALALEFAVQGRTGLALFELALVGINYVSFRISQEIGK